MDTKKPETAEEYMLMVEQFAWLADVELKKLEQIAENADMSAVARRLQGVVSIVNVIGYLRGQDGYFIDDRPSGLTREYQKQLYAIEDEAEHRLHSLIRSVCQKPESIKEYVLYLRTYYLQNRIPQEYRELAGFL